MIATLRIATRTSALALAQARLVAAGLGVGVELVTVRTAGDVDARELTAIGGTGVFVGEVRAAVLAGRADVAVHSYKDLPIAEVDGLVLAAVPERAEVADVLVVRAGPAAADVFDGLRDGARIGTGSPRRATQLRALARDRGLDIEVVAVRGNVPTRVRLVSDGAVDAVVVAAAGLDRLGLGERPGPGLVGRRFAAAQMLPAPAQGALAVECRADAPDPLRSVLAALDDRATRQAVAAERAVLAALGAGCLTPVGALARPIGPGELRLVACLADAAGLLNRVTVDGPATDPARLGDQAAARLDPRHPPGSARGDRPAHQGGAT